MPDKSSNGRSPHSLILSFSDPSSPYLDAYRRLYRKILQIKDGRKIKVLGVTSPDVAEGKTLTAINLSLAIAEDQTKRVLLIDADFRRPKTSYYLGISAAKGLADIIHETSTCEQVVRTITPKQQNLHYLPAGKLRSDIYPIIYEGKIKSVLESISDLYDFMILDTPPIVPVPEQAFIADYLDGMLLIVRANQTTNALLKATLEMVDEEKLIGILLNSADKSPIPYYSYGSYNLK